MLPENFKREEFVKAYMDGKDNMTEQLKIVEIREAVPNDAEAISELNNLQMGYRLSIKDTYEKYYGNCSR